MSRHVPTTLYGTHFSEILSVSKDVMSYFKCISVASRGCHVFLLFVNVKCKYMVLIHVPKNSSLTSSSLIFEKSFHSFVFQTKDLIFEGFIVEIQQSFSGHPGKANTASFGSDQVCQPIRIQNTVCCYQEQPVCPNS